jgi:small GTP-binding protein
MGTSISKILWYNNEKEVKVSMIGNDAAGKTTILYRLLKGETVTTIPTMGFNVETIKYKNLKLNVWDIMGGNDKGRCLIQRQICPISDAIILVIDSNDIDRINEACGEFHHVHFDLNNKNIPILVYANKQDLPNAMSPAEILKQLFTYPYGGECLNIHIQGTCATSGDGLYEGLEWLCYQLN